MQIYQYEGKKIYGLMWHTLDGGVEIRKIKIIITPPKISTTEVKISIKYPNNELKQYKVGASNTNWSEYTQEITLTSKEVLEKGWKNEDNTVTLYVKGKDEEGKEIIEEHKIKNLDLDPPKAPIIKANYGYPIITQYGIGYSKDNITYDTRTDIDNYYSVDNGVTWIKYTGNVPVSSGTTIIAKSVKKESGLEVRTSMNVSMPSDAMGTAAYDENTNTYFQIKDRTSRRIYVSEDIQGKQIIIDAYWWDSDVIISFKKSDGVEISRIRGINNLHQKRGTYTLTIPQNTSYIELNPYGDGQRYINVYEITIEDTPSISGRSTYPIITQSGIVKPYNTITINYFPTSNKRLYSLDNKATWENYENTPIKLNVGQTIYAKGIKENGKETVKTSSYSFTAPSDAIGPEAYDENTNTYFYIKDRTSKRIYVSEDMQGKQIIIDAYWWSADTYIRFKKSDGTEISNVRNTVIQKRGSQTFTIPQNTSYIELNPYGDGQRYINVHEITIKY